MDNAQKEEIIRCIVAYIRNRLPPSYHVNLTDHSDSIWRKRYELILRIGKCGINYIDWRWPSIDTFFIGCTAYKGTTRLSFFEHIESICSYKWVDKPTVNAVKPLLAMENMKTYEEMKMFFDINS